MKNLFLAVLMTLSFTAFAQTGKVYNLDKKDTSSVSYKKTNDVAIYHGEKMPVYTSARGKSFIFVTSKKSGKQYKKYLN
jgi:hypothetical protein